MTIKRELGQRLFDKKEGLMEPDYRGNDAREARKPLKPKKFRNRFLVRRRIAEGKGSDTKLFSMQDKDTGRDVCAKIFFGNNGPLLQEFRDRIATRNSIGESYNLIELYEAMPLKGSETHPMLLMELGIEGLRKKLLGLDEGTTLSLEETLYVGSSICLAVRDVHAHDLANIDLKPDHVLYTLGQEGEQPVGLVKLCDVFETARESGQTTRTIGRSDRYAAPEIGIADYKPDPLSDIYPVGLILYEMATSSYFFINEKGREIKGRSREEVKGDGKWVEARLASMQNRYLAAVIGGCLQPKPGDRYQTAEEVANELAKIELWRASHEPVLYIDWSSQPSAEQLGVVYDARVAVAAQADGSKVVPVLDKAVVGSAVRFSETYHPDKLVISGQTLDPSVVTPLKAVYEKLFSEKGPLSAAGVAKSVWEEKEGRFSEVGALTESS